MLKECGRQIFNVFKLQKEWGCFYLKDLATADAHGDACPPSH